MQVLFVSLLLKKKKKSGNKKEMMGKNFPTGTSPSGFISFLYHWKRTC